MNKAISQFIERGWYQASPPFRLLLPVLWPVSLLFIWLATIRRHYLEKNRTCQLPLPLIIVGNITVGGTGKTPLLVALASALQVRGMRPGIISRGYGGSYNGTPRTVSAQDVATVVGDEPLLLACRTGCPVVIGRDRVAAAQYLATQGVTVILSDDGLQHYALPRTVEIAVVDGQRGLGNGLCLPAGPLREPPVRLQSVNIVVSNGESQVSFHPAQYTMHLTPLCWRHLQGGGEQPLGSLPVTTCLHAVAGIGHPGRFFTTLREMGYNIIEHAFPDHHVFSLADITFADDLPVVMTEKDAVKCGAFARSGMYALIVAATVPDAMVDAVVNRLKG